MAEEKMVKFTINGQKVEAKPKEVLLDVARRNGIKIPTLCYYKAIPGYGSCRLCIVEVTKKGRTKLTASCTYPVEDGIEVKTDSAEVVESRKMLMELLMARCPESEEIKKLAKEIGVEKTRFKSNENRDNKCILCGLCVRVCQEVMGANVLCFANRGANRKVTKPFEQFSEICTTCGACEKVCPTDAIHISDITKKKVKPIVSEHDCGLAPRNANYIPFPQAVPTKAVIDSKYCMHFLTGKCGACENFCDIGAIDYNQKEEIVKLDVGAIIVSSGFDFYDIRNLAEYGYGRINGVITAMELERFICASGPTSGHLHGADNKDPKSIAFIQCAGSRDFSHLPYCSAVCCMHSTKEAILANEHYPDLKSYIFYIDLRAVGKGFQNYLKRAQEQYDVTFIRSKVGRITENKENGKPQIQYEETRERKVKTMDVDLVVLAQALCPSKSIFSLSKTLGFDVDEHGFIISPSEAKSPMDTTVPGIFACGFVKAPQDIPDSVAQASGAAARAAEVLLKGGEKND